LRQPRQQRRIDIQREITLAPPLHQYQFFIRRLGATFTRQMPPLRHQEIAHILATGRVIDGLEQMLQRTQHLLQLGRSETGAGATPSWRSSPCARRLPVFSHSSYRRSTSSGPHTRAVSLISPMASTTGWNLCESSLNTLLSARRGPLIGVAASVP